MNNELFRASQQAYAAKDFEGALNGFTACLQDTPNFEPGDTGLVYHQIGNCLVKLRNPAEAIQAYTLAVADEDYASRGAVNYNLGMAYAALRDYENAIKGFNAAISDAQYETPYKAYSSLGNALMKMGKTVDAGIAYREAAMDPGNPDPTKALMNLGVCFMALNHPEDAILTYESAEQFPMSPEFSNKLYANLGQAYTAAGRMQDAVSAFEKALEDKTYFLSDSASVDYQHAIAAVSTGTAADLAVPADPYATADMSGLDISSDGSGPLAAQDDFVGFDQPVYQPGYEQGTELMEVSSANATGVVPQVKDSDRFFTATDEELEQWSKGLAKQERKRRNVGLKVLIVAVVIILLVFGAGVFAYIQGYGYPTQETVAMQLFSDPDNASECFADGVDDAAVKAVMAAVVADKGATVEGVNKGMSESTAYVKAQTELGGELTYEVSMVRDMIGWKVSNVELYFPSQN